MKSFGKLLKEYINGSEVSVNGFASEIQFDRGWLNNIFTGKKTLPVEKLDSILSVTYFSDLQKEQLRAAFFYEYFGKSEYEQVCAIAKHLQYRFYAGNKANSVAFSNHDLSKPIQISSAGKLLEIINQLIKNTDSEYIYTNFSFLHKGIDSVVYTAICGRESSIQGYHHFTTFKTDDRSTYNVDCFFEAIKYIKLRLDIRFSYETAPDKAVQNTPFPYYFITSIGFLQYDENAQSGLWMPSGKYNINFDGFIGRSLTGYAPIAIYSSSPLELQSQISNFSQMNSSVLGITGGAPCLAHYLSKSDFELLANPALENRDALIDIALDYFGFPVESKSICTYKGLYDFAVSGKLPDLPASLVQVLPCEIRAKVFDNIIKQVSEKSDSLRILKENIISLPDDIALDFYRGTSSAVFGGTLSDSLENKYYGEFLVSLQETSLRNSFMNYLEYIACGCFTYSPSYTLKLLNQLKILASS